MASQRGIAGLHQGAGNQQAVEQSGPAQHHALLCERRLNRQGIGIEAERAGGRAVGHAGLQKPALPGEPAVAAVALQVDQRHVEKLVDALEGAERSEEHTSELQSLMRISYAVFRLKKKTIT